MKRNLAIVLVLFVFTTGLSAAENWPQFRGPDGTGISANSDPVVKWNGTERIKWELGIRGKGWSSLHSHFTISSTHLNDHFNS